MNTFKNPKSIKRGIISTALFLIMIGLFPSGFEVVNDIRNTKLLKTPIYSSKAELESGFEKEKKRLDLENLAINLEVVKDPEIIGQCVYYDKNKFDILIGKEYMTTGVLRQALYHAHRMHIGEITQKRRKGNIYDTLEDWKATSYALKKD